MIRRWDVCETIASLRRVNRDGEETSYEDCVVGIESRERGVLQLDLRNLRPMRINDRESLIIELDINEVLGAIAENLRAAVKS